MLSGVHIIALYSGAHQDSSAFVVFSQWDSDLWLAVRHSTSDMMLLEVSLILSELGGASPCFEGLLAARLRISFLAKTRLARI